MGLAAIQEDIAPTFFANAEQNFYSLINTLKSRHTASMEFSDLEKLIDNDGRELLRLLLQAHVDSRGDGEVGRLLEGSDDIERTHRRIGRRQITSLFGTIECKRIGYGKPATESLFPKDSHLNLPENSHSYELQRRVALEVVKGSFDDAVEAITETTGQLIHKQQIEHIAVSVSRDFDVFYQSRSSDKNLEDIHDSSLVVLTTDGKGIVMHKDDLRPATRKKAKSGKKKAKHSSFTGREEKFEKNGNGRFCL